MKRFIVTLPVLLLLFMAPLAASDAWKKQVKPIHAIYAMSTGYPYLDEVEYPYFNSPPPMDVLKWSGRTVSDHSGNLACFLAVIPHESFQPVEARGYITGHYVQYAPEGSQISCPTIGYDDYGNTYKECCDPYFNGSGGYEMFTRVVKNGQTMDFFSRLTIR